MLLGYLLAEGYDDIELIGGILKRKGLKRIIQLDDLYNYWSSSNIIPEKFPYKGDLTKRVPVPAFFQNDKFSIAIQCTEGNLSKAAQNFKSTLINNPDLCEQMTGIGIVSDADTDAKATLTKIKKLFNDLFKLPDTCGTILNSSPQAGVFLFPNNKDNGTMEKILLQCAKDVYIEILVQANEYVENINKSKTKFDRKLFDKPAGKNKAVIGCISNILNPGKAVQVSIEKNDWVCDKTIANTELSKLNDFLVKLFKLT